ncbi:Uma2 family endonuclease [Leptospira ognonensis]|uniref:Uma2 family endonuclease n=1 Tax=Leptospira ognonensis TaxID=2484945 RepID=A0A4R9KB97_9LEPT|nr:Uma2 family endonuclease [Leptospira ognonensis]TGL63039.1 Uma2 family endonuclease [Leptospira ognonensis]
MSDSLLTKESPKYKGWKVTREEYLSLPDDGFVYDMIDGVLVLSPSGFFDHGSLASRFGYFLQSFLERIPVGQMTTETDMFLPDGGDVLRPDISFILKENLSIVKGHIHGVPDLVCEVLSDFTRDRDLGVKAYRYLLNGVREYWIVDPKAKVIFLWINRDKREWEKRSATVLESELVKGFSVKREEMFS